MGKDLSDEQVSAMKEAFSLFDTDGDGRIAPSELGILMRSLGGNPTQAQLKSIVAEENLTAPFDFPQFLDLMAKHVKPEPFDRQLRDAFKVLDKDSTGFVSVSELRHILTNIGEKLEPSEFDEWIREVDVGPDGKIRYEDFIARMASPLPPSAGIVTSLLFCEYCGLLICNCNLFRPSYVLLWLPVATRKPCCDYSAFLGSTNSIRNDFDKCKNGNICNKLCSGVKLHCVGTATNHLYQLMILPNFDCSL
ncbi:hypothetical protein VNO80_09832 [Phaseolus coccineus]|uniref:EF-hand domain-containing protein n=1 Tax=Phaseolus coccineus TaxID=3886 RepID=A0AAN9N6Y8_PHACN